MIKRHTQDVSLVKPALSFLLTVIMALLVALFIMGPIRAHAQPVELPYSNHTTSADGTLTVAINGSLYAVYHGHSTQHPTSLVKDCSNTNKPMYFLDYGLMVRAAVDVTDAATGASYRLHGHFNSDGLHKYPVPGWEMCNGIYSATWQDSVSIITDTGAVRKLTMKFYIEIDLAAGGELLHIEVDSVELI
jgi:biopolymer transport protein ExbD